MSKEPALRVSRRQSSAGLAALGGFLLAVAVGAWQGWRFEGPASEPAPQGHGLWVESCLGATCTLLEGDLLLSWHRRAGNSGEPAQASGFFRGPEDWFLVGLEEIPRGPVELEVARQTQILTVTFDRAAPELELRPRLPAEEESQYLAGSALRRKGDLGAALALWDGLAERLARDGRLREAVWLANRAVAVSWKNRDRVAAERWGDRACGWADSSGDELLRFQARLSSLEALIEGDRLAKAELRLEEAATLSLARRGGSLAMAEVLRARGWLLDIRGQLERAGIELQAAVEMVFRVAPDSVRLAGYQLRLATILSRRSRPEEALALLNSARDTLMRRAPEMVLVGHVLNRLGMVTGRLGDLVSAEAFLREAMAHFERLAPGAGMEIPTLNNLGLLAKERGKLAEAESLLVRALLGRELLSLDFAGDAVILANLGGVALDRSDLDGAKNYLERSVAAFESVAVDNPVSAIAWRHLGELELRHGNKALAKRHLQRALVLEGKVATYSPLLVSARLLLAEIGIAESDPVATRRFLHEIGGLAQAFNPRRKALIGGEISGLEARLAIQEGRFEDAERMYRAALEVRSELFPGTALEASSAYELARLLRRRGDRLGARTLLERAIASIENHQLLVGGLEIHQYHFASQFAQQYRELIDLLAELGQPSEAMALLERSRARVFLTFLAERELSFAADLPPELEQRRRRVDAEYDQLLANRLRAAQEGTAVASFEEELRRVRQRQQDVRARIHAIAPRVAALNDPRPISAEAAAARLDDSTRLLAYSVGAARSWLFVISPGGQPVEAHALEIGAAELGQKITRLRQAISERTPVELLSPLLAQLSDDLLAPAAGALAGARRLGFIVDGPLHALPLSVLYDPTSMASPAAPRRLLIESKGLFKVASATVLAELEERPVHSGPRRVRAFGDPIYRSPMRLAQRAASPRLGARPYDALRSPMARGFKLEPLPSTREEVEGLRRLFSEAAEVFLGEDATEEQAKSLTRGDSLVHFACHGYVDAHSPLESGLVLSLPTSEIPGGENGVLQAWEILEDLRLDADLVTLSACETGLGSDFGGEGIVGLTRAFQHAGARSVLSSLWRVGDSSTARLMSSFYRRLKDGSPKAEALAAAQLEMAGVESQTGTAHPYDWAAFELVGDGR